jgi:hypothetical protein
VRARVNGSPGARRSARFTAAALAVWLGAAATLASAADKDEEKKGRPDLSEEGSVTGEAPFLDAPPFPDVDISDAFRIRLEALTAPDTSVGSGHVSVVRPELGVRATWPVSDRMILRLAIRIAQAAYRFRGNVWGPAIHVPTGTAFDGDHLIGDLDLHAGRVSLESAYRLSENTNWLANGEQWSVVGSAFIGSRWEDGDIESGQDAGAAIGVGYEIPERLRAALGVSLRTRLDEAELDFDPFISLRWRPVERLTVRTRELGLQIEYEYNPAIEFYLAGFRSTDGYRLRDRRPLGDLIFRDRHIRAGTGIDLTLARWMHLEFEVGAIFERRLRVREDDRGTLLSQRADPSVYFEVRFDLRP